jgi:molybdate transport system ATP-binding protein
VPSIKIAGARTTGSKAPGTRAPRRRRPGAKEPGSTKPGAKEPGSTKPGAKEPGSTKPGTRKIGLPKRQAGKPAGGSRSAGAVKTSAATTGSEVAGTSSGPAESPEQVAPSLDHEKDVSYGLRAHVVVRRPGFTLDIDLEVEPGTTAALLGPNGAGKSTTVEAIAGIVAIDDGRIELAGRLLDHPASKRFVPADHRRIGVVFQQYLLFEHLDVLDNVAFGPAVNGSSRRQARARARAWLERLDLTKLAKRRPRQLSGGQAQRVALARALATEPAALLLDEPLAALDITTRSRLRRVLAAHLAEYPGPRLLITHEPADAFLLADTIHVVEDGRLTQSGRPAEIRRHPATPYVAALAGRNLLAGTNSNGTIILDGHSLDLHTADTHTNGPVLVTIAPNAVALHPERPHGSPRNAWSTAVDAVESLGEVNRITLGDPLPLLVDVTPAATSALDLVPGLPIWASIKATEISVSPT